MKLNVAIFSIWFSVGMPSFVMGQGATERADSVPTRYAWVIQPLSCSLFLSSVLSDKFWTHEPDRYPKGYYGFSTRIRANLSLGQRIVYDIPDVSNWRVQDISLYYELGACDTDFCTFFGDRSIKFKEILSLAVGIKLHI